MSFVSVMGRSILWVFLFAWPLAAMVVLLWFFGSGPNAGYSSHPLELVMSLGVFAVYYPGIVIYGLTHMLHTHVGSKRKLSLRLWFMLITPATGLGLYVAAAYSGLIKVGNPIYNNWVLGIVFGYYPAIFVYMIFKSLWFYMKEQAMKTEYLITAHG